MTKKLKITTIITLLASSAVIAQEPEIDTSFSLLPLRTHNINAESRTRLAKTLDEEARNLRESLLKTPARLSDTLNQLATNNRRMSSKIWTSKESLIFAKPKQPWIIEPVWCRILNSDVMFLQIVDRNLGTLLASRHEVFSQKPALPYADRVKELEAQIPGVLNRLLTKLQAAPPDIREPTDALHLQILHRRQSSERRFAPPECITMLIEEELADRYTIVRASGLEFVQHARQNANKFRGLRRPTRNIHLSWPDSTFDDPNQNFRINARITAAEGVFGQPYPQLGNEVLDIAMAGRSFQIGLPVKLTQHLDSQRDMLLLKDAPQIVHIYGAWVYLDKGRAWGLKMRDRLVSSEQPDDIKGHIVRYFGPEAKLRDRNNQLIVEGAIMFVRKGQDKTRVGQPMTFDPKVFPAEWR